MSTKQGLVVAGCALAIVVAPPVGNAESDAIRTYRWELTDLLPLGGLGGAFHATLVGPSAGTIVHARIIAEFVSADAWDAAGVHIYGFAPIGDSGLPFDWTGADFGWSGVGTQETVFETDQLNGSLTFQLWSLHVNDLQNPYLGRFLKLRVELDVLDLVAIETCEGDLNGDREITAADLTLLELGDCPLEGPCPGDMNGDGIVTSEDRDILISRFGFVCPVGPDA